MNQAASTLRPDWVSDDMYPFASRVFSVPSGHRMHFVDEGEGEPVVFIHGNPAWSFEFRHQICELRSEFRCIAPDHIGFGLSSRSERSKTIIRRLMRSDLPPCLTISICATSPCS